VKLTFREVVIYLWIGLGALPGQVRERERTKASDHPAAVGVGQSDLRVDLAEGGRGAGAFRRYAVVLEQPPVAAVAPVREAMFGFAGRTQRESIDAGRAGLRAAFRARGVREVGSAELLVNAVFVTATPEQMEGIEALDGVRYVQEMRPIRRTMNKANDVLRTPGAWSQVGGQANGGTGVKIAILDSGIDHAHPAFSGAGFTPPAGFPKCAGTECDWTNGKVIAARSFVDGLIYAFPDDTRPDDNSPRDRVGHGTAAAMAAAGNAVEGPLGRVSGVAPRAFLGNYKVFGSPGVNDFTLDDVIIAALEAALRDGMDIASMSLGGASVWGPNDRGSVCGRAANVACDLKVEAVENAVRQGMTVVVSAGNDGDIGVEIPTLNAIGSPGTAPSAITVGASVNAQLLFQTLRVAGGPASLLTVNTFFGNGPRPRAALTAQARNVTELQNDGKACSSLGSGSLSGAIAVIERGDCSFLTKVLNAQRAGAVGVILFQANSNGIFSPGGLANTAIPLVLIGRDNGQALVAHLAANPGARVTLDPLVRSVDAPAGEIAIFSSQGPSTGENAIKPEIVAVGTDVLLATQNYDPNGEMYDASRYGRSTGTSFSAPMVAGAAALVKQRSPNFTPAQIKSALVNTANQQIDDFDYDGNRIRALQSGMGGGQLDAASAVRTNLTANPATLSFGVVAPLPQSRTVQVRNNGNAAVNLRASIAQRVPASGVTVTVTPASVDVPAGATATFTLRIDGTRPTASNWYEGDILVEGGASPLRIPYGYLVGDNLTFNVFPLGGDGFVARVDGQTPRLVAKFVDKQGVPVQNLSVRYRAEVGGGRIIEATGTTDNLGIAEARAATGSLLGEQVFSVEGGGKRIEFIGRAIQRPLIQSGGVVNAASSQTGPGLAPGSYISIFGAALADSTLVFSTPYLPLSLANVSVGFDVPGVARTSYPARIHFVSPGQINVQVPWELAGRAAADLKVSIGDFSSATVRIALQDVSPAAFEYTDPASGRLLAAALDENFALVTAAAPVRRGRVVQLYANGLGPVTNTPPTGEPAGAQPLSQCRVQPEVTIGGQNASVQFCGLAPGFVGLYQLNVTVPESAQAGIQPLILRSNNILSKTASLPIL
jgi:minor extracellular serine protease Vpr